MREFKLGYTEDGGEAAYFKSPDELVSILDGIAEGIILVDRKHNILWANKYFIENLRHPRKKVAGLKCYKVIHNFGRACKSCVVRKMFQKGVFCESTHSHLQSDGSRIWHEVKAHPVRDRKGKAIQAVYIFRDVTKTREMIEVLRESEEKFRLAFESAKDAIIWADPKTGIIVNCNTAAEKLLEKKKSEIIGQSQAKLHPKNKADFHIKQFRRHVKSKGPVADEAEVITKSGEIKNIHITASVTTVGDKQIIQGVFRDITERKRMENLRIVQHNIAESLTSMRDLKAASNMLLDSLFTLKDVDCGGIYLVDEETGELNLFASKGLSRHFIEKTRNFTADSPQTKLVKKGKPVYTRYSLLSPLINLRTDGARLKEGLKALAVIPVKHNNRVIASLNLASHKNDEIPAETKNTLETIAVQIGGVIARLASEEALRESEDKYRTLVENSIEGIGISRGNRVVFANKALLDIFGYKTVREFSKIPLTDHVAPESRKLIRDRMARRKKGGRLAPRYEYKIIRKDGETRDIDIYTSDVFIGREHFVQSTFRDITDQKKAEEIIKKEVEALRELDKMKSEFISIASHEIKTPLSVIKSYSDVLSSGVLGKTTREQGKIIEKISGKSLELAELVDDIMGLSRLDAEGGRLGKTRFSLRKLAGEVVEELRFKASDKNVKLYYSLRPKDIMLNADREKIKRLLRNLLDNSIKFTKASGRVAFTAKKTAGVVVITVSDTGIGLNKDELVKVFDKFYQADSSTTRRYRGTGLGLAICKRIVEQHGGEIKIESKPGEGTKVRVLLP